MRKRDDLLDSLTSGLVPVAPAPNLRTLTLVWLLVSACYVVVLTHFLGPIRPTAINQLQSEPRFMLEMLLGAMAAVGLAAVAFRAATPAALGRGVAAVVGAMAVLWIGGLVAGLFSPALEPSMLGKRDHCYVETFVYAVPPLVGLLYWQRKLYPLQPEKAALLAGLAAGVLPALYMQIACMYQPSHILAFHVGPALVVAAIAPLLLRLWRPRSS